MTVHIDIDIDGAQPMRGRVRTGDGDWTEWVGWVALAVILGEAADTADLDAQPEPER